MWEVSWRRRQTATYWPQVPLTIAALLPHSAGLLNRGLEGSSPLSGTGSLYGILSPTTTGTHCLELNSDCLELRLTQAVCGTWWRPPASRGRLHRFQPRPKGKGDTPISRPDVPVIYTGASLKWLLGRRSIIIIIMSCRQHRYPWPSLATSTYHSLPPAGLLGYIPCPHIAAVCKFGLVVLLLLGHMWGSIEVRHLRARPCFSSSVRRVWLV